MSFGALTVLDLVLAPALLLLAGALLNLRDVFTAIVLFIVFGLLMAVTWARLDAVDIALAEAAIGAGLTGALLLGAFGELARRGAIEHEHEPGELVGSRVAGRRVVAAALLAAPLLGLGLAIAATPGQIDRLGPLAAAHLPQTGSEHGVTAVLLAYRGYDTLLELSVLLLAVIGIWSSRLFRLAASPPPRATVLLLAERVLIPTVVLLGGYLVWHGSHAPGGAFQGGATIAGALVLLHLGARDRWPNRRSRASDLALVAGVLGFLAVGLAGLLAGRPFLYFRGAWAARVTVLLELAATLAIAVALLAIFVGRPHFDTRVTEEDA